MSTRKKRNRPARRRPSPIPLLSALDMPVWEYAEYARTVAADTGETAEEVLNRLLVTPIRVISPPPDNGYVDDVTPAEVASDFAPEHGADDLHEWLKTMAVLHDAGFCEWDAATRAHRLIHRDHPSPLQESPDGGTRYRR